MFKKIYGLLIILLMLSCVSSVIAGDNRGQGHDLVSPTPSPELQAAIDKKYADLDKGVKTSSTRSAPEHKKSVYTWTQQEAWDHDSNQKIKIYLLLDGIWYEHYVISPSDGYYYHNYPVEFDSIAEGINVTFSLHQEGYNCYIEKDYSTKIEKYFTGNQAYPNTPNVSSHCKTKYQWYWAIWYWEAPDGIEMGWNN